MAACNKLLDSLATATYASSLKPPIPSRFFPIVKPFQLRRNTATFNSNLPNDTRKSLDLSKANAGRHAEPCLEQSLLAKTENTTVNLSATVMIKHARPTDIKDPILQLLNASTTVNGLGVLLQLVSSEVDPQTREPKLSREAVLRWTKSLNVGLEHQTYKVEFNVDSNFGLPGAITVCNNYEKEFFLMNISTEGYVHFDCNSWVQPGSKKRAFFSNEAYLPSETPAGLKKLREIELEELRGDGNGIRLASDRIYDYDVYNDLGNPDKGVEYARPTLGGEENPHPRRCRTGRTPTTTDKKAETPASASVPAYVPRDEEFQETKDKDISRGKLKGIIRYFILSLMPNMHEEKDIFKFSEGDAFQTPLPDQKLKALPILDNLNSIQCSVQEFLKFDPPKNVPKDVVLGLRDDEFARRVVAGINPLNIERLTVFPPASKLDPLIYGSQESALKEEHITSHLDGMSVQQAMDKKKLFVLDYHDAYIPFLNQINALGGRKSYATRTLFFLTSVGTLKPIAIELSLPPGELTPPSKQVLTPPVDATSNWLWQLAKAHVCTNDAGVHQLVNHWLRVHACMEPFIIAAHRHLSAMHPIFKLLDPHMRYTLKINATARETLINAGGIVESFFTPGQYSMQLCCSAYKDWWRFDKESLPADLVRRGIAEPDNTKEHGLRLLIEDYPYANDGLLYWSAIENLVKTYVNYYYPEESLIQNDKELQAWYSETIDVGHADLRFATWWPRLDTTIDLINVLTTLIWIASAQHAALNFGQYPYGGHVPTRPPLMKKLLPQENNPAEYASFLSDPKGYILSSLPSLDEAAKFVSILNILSAHSTDEEYIGQRDLSCWSGHPKILEAFYRFSMDIKLIEQEIEKRNSNPRFRNRCGAGIPPYELLLPSSGPGVTSRGVPNSISV